MKFLFILIYLLPLIDYGQKVKFNEYDKFSKKMTVELEPITVLATEKSKLSITYSAEGPSLFVVLNGFGWGGNTIDASNDVVFLFSNDSTVSVHSTGFQAYEQALAYSVYKHQYRIDAKDLELLSKFDIVGIRKYSFKNHSDLTIPKDYAQKVKKASSVFVDELKKAKIIKVLQYIEIADIGKHIGDSVMFCNKVFGSKYFDNSDRKPTILDLSNDFTNSAVNVVIWGENRAIFNNSPEKLYNNRLVCVQGVVELYKNIPQIVITNRNQIVVKSPISLDEVAMFIGDSVTVRGRVATSKYFASTLNSPTLLNMGKDYPNQALALVIDKNSAAQFEQPINESFVHKELLVNGRISLYKGKPEIKIYQRQQISFLSTDAVVMATLTKNQVQSSKLNNSTTTESKNLQNKAVTNYKEELKVKPEKAFVDTTKKIQSVLNTANKDLFLIDALAEFPGGNEAALSFIQSNLKVPTTLKKGEKQVVWARFTVEKNGEISNITVTKKVDDVFYKEAVRVVASMPKWQPAIANGKPIVSIITQLITFIGSGDNDK